MKKTLFIKNAAVLTVSSLLLRFAGIIFKVWLAAAVGAEGIGLYQLVFSFYVLAATFATSGICTAVTRLVASELALGSKSGVLRIIRRCLELTLIIAAVTVAILLLFSDFIAQKLIGDARAASAVKILSLSLPFMGISSCLKGYFIARRRATPTASSQLFEQAIRIALVMFLVTRFSSRGLEFTCAAVLFGDTAAEIISTGLLYILYAKDKRRLCGLCGRNSPPYGIVKEVTRISLPITAGRYLNTALRTGENVLVPKGLSKFPSAGANAMSQFGMIKGMALPLLFFPSTLLNALSTLLIPEMSEAAARGRKAVVRSAVERILRVTALVSFPVSAVFMTAGGEIGQIIYKSGDVGFLLCALAPIVPLMYLDSVSDGILKGLDQQGFTFRTSVADSSLRIILVILLLPRFGINGFIGIMYFSNLLTCFLNVGRLLNVSDSEIDPLRAVIIPIICAFLSAFLFRAFLFCFNFLPPAVYVVLLCLFTCIGYSLLLFAFRCITTDDIRDIIR